MPWTTADPPPPATNWSRERKQRCVAAANAVLRGGGTEEEAIQACIHNAREKRRDTANRVSDVAIKLYEQERDKARETFGGLAESLVANSISLDQFDQQMREGIRSHYIRTALIAKGENPFTQRDQEDLGKFLTLSYSFLDGFIEDLRQYKKIVSDAQAIARASSYGVGWGVFSRYTMPGVVVDMLPDLPGISCLGNGDCGCVLLWEKTDTSFEVYWEVNPFKAHCPICAALAIDWSPLEITFEEIREEYGEDVFGDDGELVEF